MACADAAFPVRGNCLLAELNSSSIFTRRTRAQHRQW